MKVEEIDKVVTNLISINFRCSKQLLFIPEHIITALYSIESGLVIH